MNTASKEWCDQVAARNAIEVAKAQWVWQPGLPFGSRPAEAGRADTDKAGVALSAAGKEGR